MSPRKKVGAQDWVDALLGALDADRTPAETSVADLAGILGVTKGAFYPHFANTAALYEAAIAEWLRDRLAAMPYTAVSSAGAVRDPLDRIRKIAEALANRGTRDGAMRRWAATDTVAANAVALADRIVISHLEHALTDLGFPAAEAAAQAAFIAAALRSTSIAANQESFNLVLDGLDRAAAYTARMRVVQSSQDQTGAVVLYTRRAGLTRDHLQVLQRVADMLAGGEPAEPPDGLEEAPPDGQAAGPPPGQEQEHAGTS